MQMGCELFSFSFHTHPSIPSSFPLFRAFSPTAVFSMLFHLTFAYLTLFCFGTRSDFAPPLWWTGCCARIRVGRNNHGLASPAGRNDNDEEAAASMLAVEMSGLSAETKEAGAPRPGRGGQDGEAWEGAANGVVRGYDQWRTQSLVPSDSGVVSSGFYRARETLFANSENDLPNLPRQPSTRTAATFLSFGFSSNGDKEASSAARREEGSP